MVRFLADAEYGRKRMDTDVLVVGGGLSGLTAVWQLQQAGIEACLVEARPRFGGRILTTNGVDKGDCDLGPSWFWPGQPLVANLLTHFEIPSFEQFSTGAMLYQQADGQVFRLADRSPMAGARRMAGGIGRLIEALAQQIDPTKRLLNHEVCGLTVEDDHILVDVQTDAGQRQIKAKRVAVAMPPRLAANLTYAPALPSRGQQMLQKTPTWMGQHAKFFAVYDRGFWREGGLCGSVMSRRGPLVEIHDASPASGEAFCLFGFVGIDAPARQQIGRNGVIEQVMAQLVSIFGEDAGSPTAVYLQDWSQERFTAADSDQGGLSHHPQYGLDLLLGEPWHGRLDFIATETTFGNNGGLIEGALEAALKFAQAVIDERVSE